jgi:hypothetical protein
MTGTRSRTSSNVFQEIERITGVTDKAPSSGRIQTPSSSGMPAADPLSGDPRPDLSGRRLVRPGYAEIYLIDPEGYRRRVPNHTTYSRLFRDWTGITDEPALSEIPGRPALTLGTVLMRGASSVRIYLLDRGTKRLVAEAAVMDKYWFHWAKIYVVSQSLIDGISTGDDWH